jgi:hypothetical protein
MGISRVFNGYEYISEIVSEPAAHGQVVQAIAETPWVPHTIVLVSIAIAGYTSSAVEPSL